MLPSFLHLPDLPGTLQVPFSGQLRVFVSCLLIAIGWVVLAFPATASAHTLGVPGTYRCLSVRLDYAVYGATPGNSAQFYFTMYNLCGIPVYNIAFTYQETALCNGVSSGIQQKHLTIPDLPEDTMGTLTITAHGYCITCHDGQISGFPPFTLWLEIKDAVGIQKARGHPLATLGPSTVGTTALLLNDFGNTGGLSCGNGKAPSQ